MKTLIPSILFLFCFNVPNSFSQDEDPFPQELVIFNNSTTNRTINIKLYPVSMVFRGDHTYNLISVDPAGFSSGVYFAVLIAGAIKISRKMVFLK